MQEIPAYLRTLVTLKFVELDRAETVYPRCRDRDDITVCRSQTGVIFLLQSTRDYRQGDVQSYFRVSSRDAALRNCEEDDSRRIVQFRAIARNAIWLDVGCGVGGFLEKAKPLCAEIVGVEPQEEIRESAIKAGLRILESIRQAPTAHFDVVSLFHVFEHLEDPLALLSDVRRCLKPGGRLIVEVPHARDFLLSFLDVEPFRAHTFWSEHLILHTRDSLRAFLQAAGFVVNAVSGYQRYPLANHLYWLRHGKAGGHKHWECLRESMLDQAYASKLNELDATDTIIATAIRAE